MSQYPTGRITIDTALLEALPVLHRATIDESYLDENAHMNVQWYFALFNTAADRMFERWGITDAFIREQQHSVFALRQFVSYLNEVHAGDNVALRVRVLGRSTRRVHMLHFLVNETRASVAAIMEGLTSFADLRTRRTAPFAEQVAAAIDRDLVLHQTLEWNAPITGVIAP